jgi:uncharacterized protein YjbJ (UPF0337 family)
MGEVKDRANEVAGNVKQGAGKAKIDPALHAEDKAHERKGEAQQAFGKVKGAVGNSI